MAKLPLSLVCKALPYMGIEHSSDSEAHHLITILYNVDYNNIYIYILYIPPYILMAV